MKLSKKDYGKMMASKPTHAYRPIELVGGALFAIGILLFLAIVYVSIFPVDDRAQKAASVAFGAVWITAMILVWWNSRRQTDKGP